MLEEQNGLHAATPKQMGLAAAGAPSPVIIAVGSGECAGVLLLRRRDGLEILARPRHGWAWLVDVPLVLDLGGLQRLDRIHLVHELMVPVTKIAWSRLE